MIRKPSLIACLMLAVIISLLTFTAVNFYAAVSSSSMHAGWGFDLSNETSCDVGYGGDWCNGADFSLNYNSGGYYLFQPIHGSQSAVVNQLFGSINGVPSNLDLSSDTVSINNPNNQTVVIRTSDSTFFKVGDFSYDSIESTLCLFIRAAKYVGFSSVRASIIH